MSGSSPRGRGTRALGLAAELEHRFIPARAGNAASRSCPPCRASVHPRAGGERRGIALADPVRTGSSPRGRGTHRACACDGNEPRFIPARAGNASLHPHCPVPGSVHPRAGGERYGGSRKIATFGGSSPRGRGTLQATQGGIDALRFIPARAGNAVRPCSPRAAWTVHPRAGGERFALVTGASPATGSSPRGRGTPAGDGRDGAGVRFIPARAGNASARLIPPPMASVHPRAGGERMGDPPGDIPITGSSPRGRGTLDRGERRRSDGRFIPARAGNARG